MKRRRFLQANIGLLAAQNLPIRAVSTPVRFGIDVFSIRSQGWTPFQYIDYVASLGADVIFFSELRFLGSLHEEHLKKIRQHAEDRGLKIELGMTSICPTSKRFDPSRGSAEEQLQQAIRVATVLGSPIVRCYLGSAEDRKAPGGIKQHIANTVRVLKNVRSFAQDHGVKIAVENHAGDMQAGELKQLIEDAGPDFVGATVDSGNSVWTLEDPHLTLEVLAPYALTSGVRDSAVWRDGDQIAVQWTALGEGTVGLDSWIHRFTQLCPQATLALEIIILPTRRFPIFDPSFWQGYETVRAHEFVRFLKLAEQGKPRAEPPRLQGEQAKAFEREALEKSVDYCLKLLSKQA